MANEKLIDIGRLERFWQNIRTRSCYMAECNTVSSTAMKQIYAPQFILTKGARIIVDFKVANVAENPTLKVNDDNEAVPIIGPDGVLTNDQLGFLNGFCELIYDGENFVLMCTEEKVRNQVVYGDEPEMPFAGMIWLKPKE